VGRAGSQRLDSGASGLHPGTGRRNTIRPATASVTDHVSETNALPVTLREFYKHTVAVNETLLITEKGCKPFSKLSRKLVRKG